MTRMNRILEIDEVNATAHVEAGIVTADLQAAVEKRRPVLPARPVQHPTFDHRREYCLQCRRSALPEIRRDRRLRAGSDRRPGRWSASCTPAASCIKDVVGYDLNALFTGSEGTLGIITEALLRLIAKPSFARTALVEFPALEDASPHGQCHPLGRDCPGHAGTDGRDRHRLHRRSHAPGPAPGCGSHPAHRDGWSG